VSFFTAPADAYDSFMGRYSAELSPQIADLADVQQGQCVVDVGCGPGALTAELVRRGAAVSAVDPSPQFVAAARERNPTADVREAGAEELPYADDEFDAALAQLVVHFMADPDRGLHEMARVTRADGVVAACVWDFAGGRSPLGPFWRAVQQLDPGADDESERAGSREGHLGELFREVGLRDIVEEVMHVRVQHETFDDWWQPFKLGVGPAGMYVAAHPEREQEIHRLALAELGEPFALEARAWAARGIV
jgi:SAM-dependent methyltransferase